jgi:hypothetical protein
MTVPLRQIARDAANRIIREAEDRGWMFSPEHARDFTINRRNDLAEDIEWWLTMYFVETADAGDEE